MYVINKRNMNHIRIELTENLVNRKAYSMFINKI